MAAYHRHYARSTNRTSFSPRPSPSPPPVISTNRTQFPPVSDTPSGSNPSTCGRSSATSILLNHASSRPSDNGGTPDMDSDASRNVNLAQPVQEGADSDPGRPTSREPRPHIYDGLIPPPHGPLSKPNCGGYSLSTALGWSNEIYKDVQDIIHDLCQEHLDLQVSYMEQDPHALSLFHGAVGEALPFLDTYLLQWPARDFAKMYLKNTSAQYRATRRHARTSITPLSTKPPPVKRFHVMQSGH